MLIKKHETNKNIRKKNTEKPMIKSRFILKYNKTIMAVLFIFLINYIVNTYKIEKGSKVVWDEAHFGKFGGRYLRREFYFDVHPPLGKLMTALSGYQNRQDLDFKFDSGTPYPEGMDYVGMRRFHAFISSFIPIFAFGILKELGYRMEWCFLISLLYVFENGFTSISRLILLDSHLLFFTGSTSYFLARVYKNRRYSNNLNLLCAGISIGCVLSVKWIGCLTTLMFGLYIIYELWKVLLSKKSFCTFANIFAKRVFFLIVIPVCLYVSWFGVHFFICKKSTTDEAHMSSLFQATLESEKQSVIKKYVSYGSIITLKSNKMAGGNLHSHANDYPDTDYRQITTYFHKDENNQWAFQKVIESEEIADFLKNNDNVVLFHPAAKCYLASDTQNAYLSEGKRVVGIKDVILASAVWIIEIVKDDLLLEERMKTITTRFRLKNKETGLYLNWSGKVLPQWGFGQGEVTCVKEKGSGTLWNVEENSLDKSPENVEYKEIRNLRTNFLKHVIELNHAMYNTNKSLVQEKNLEPVRIVSKPYEWFIMRRGLRMNSWDDDSIKFYMFGNPVVWYLSSICVLLSPLILLFKVIRNGRNKSKTKSKEFFEVFLCFGGWALHYLPFFAIGRVLYFHHYFPALFFAIMGIHYCFKGLPARYITLVLVAALISYFYFSELTYGIVGSQKNIASKKWIKSWDFCD